MCPLGLSSVAAPITPAPARATAFLPQLGKGSDLALLTPRVCQITAIKGRKVQLKNTAHLFIEEYGICYIPAETLPKSQVGLFLYISK